MADKDKADKSEDDKVKENLRAYFSQVSRGRYMPKDPYQHGYAMLDSETEKETVTSFSQIVDKYIQLATIKDDHLLRLIQTDALLLTHLYDMAKRDEGIAHTFSVLYYGWRSELLLTKTKNGSERKLQGAIGTSYTPKESMPGYGSDLPMPGQDDNEEANFLQKLFKRRKG